MTNGFGTDSALGIVRVTFLRRFERSAMVMTRKKCRDHSLFLCGHNVGWDGTHFANRMLWSAVSTAAPLRLLLLRNVIQRRTDWNERFSFQALLILEKSLSHVF